MHELSLAESMLELMEESALAEGFTQVSKINLEIGALSHVSEEAMIFCFDAITKGTIAENSALEISTEPGKGKCQSCHQIVSISNLYDCCPLCGQFGMSIMQGDQVRIKSLEVS